MKSKWEGVIKPKQAAKTKPRHSETPAFQVAESPQSQARSVGRPRTGKRSNPEYRQVSAWVRKDTYEQVTKRLFLEEDRREFSDLVQSLLDEWLK